MRSMMMLMALSFATTGCDRGAKVQAEQSQTTPETIQEKSKKKVATSTNESAKQALASLGAPAPDFTLKSTSGKTIKLSQFKGKTVVLEWFNPDCPFVKVAHREGKLGSQAFAHIASGGIWLAINSGAPGLQGHGLERNKKATKEYGLTYPLLLDETGKVGKLYGAQKTPHMYVIDGTGTLVYRGGLDSTGGAGYGGQFDAYLMDALRAVGQGSKPPTAESKAWGCSVKYAR